MVFSPGVRDIHSDIGKSGKRSLNENKGYKQSRDDTNYFTPHNECLLMIKLPLYSRKECVTIAQVTTAITRFMIFYLLNYF